jgi:hypothetical protein
LQVVVALVGVKRYVLHSESSEFVQSCLRPKAGTEVKELDYTNKWQGYYFAGTQEVSHIEVARAAGAILNKHGLGKSPEPIEVSLDQIDTMVYHPQMPTLGRYLFASNSRTRPHRAEKLWGYVGSAPSWLDVLEEEFLDAVNRV